MQARTSTLSWTSTTRFPVSTDLHKGTHNGGQVHTHPIDTSAIDFDAPLPMSKNAPALQRRISSQSLQRFSKPFDDSTRPHFQDLVERLIMPLTQHLRRLSRMSEFVAIRPMVYGVTEGTAGPWAVVLCSEGSMDAAEVFCQQDWVRQLCLSNTPGVTNLEMSIEKSAYRSTASTTVVMLGSARHGDQKHWTLLVQFPTDQDDQYLYATMGGMVVVEKGGRRSLYGLTAGHTFQETHGDSAVGELEPGAQAISAFPPYFTTPTSAVYGEGAGDRDLPPEPVDASEDLPENYFKWSAPEQLSPTSFSTRARNRDWALIECVHGFGRQSYAGNNVNEAFELGEVSSQSSTVHCPVQISSSCEQFAGSMAPDLSYANLPGGLGSGFIRVYTVQLQGTHEIPHGSSGSWAHIDPFERSDDTSGSVERVYRVYGHVVGDDGFGDVYVVPLVDTLVDIKHELEASNVRLPRSTSEIDDILYFYRDILPKGPDAYSIGTSASYISEGVRSGYTTPVTEAEEPSDRETEESQSKGMTEVLLKPDASTGGERKTGQTQSTSFTANPQNTTTIAINGMRVFNKEVPDEFLLSFRAFYLQFEGPMLSYLQKAQVDFRPLTMQCLVLGVSHEDSRPYIAVYCPRPAERALNKFLKQERVRKLFERAGPKGNKLDVFVVVPGYQKMLF